LAPGNQAYGFGGTVGVDGSGNFSNDFGMGKGRGHGHGQQREKAPKKDADGVQLVQEFMRKYDLNREGQISREKFFIAWQIRFREFDPQGTGFITQEMFSARTLARDHDKALRWFNAFDSNRDGKISKEEFETAGTRLFNRLDNDASGVLTREKLLLGLSPNDAANF
jgi:Ca2+-binding EF-hand superfamily protein